MVIIEGVHRLLKKTVVLPVLFYRKFISPLKAPSCRFTPSCSAYAVEAIEKRGIIVGVILSVYRILRCNPFSKGGYDPVPERKRFKNRKGTSR